MSDRDDRLVLLAVASDEVEASIWKDLLETEGIGVFMKRKDALPPFYLPSLTGSFEIFVQARDEKRARWVLGEDAAPA